jgi:hypothetical protein
MSLSNFSAFAMTRAEMKNVVGGAYCVITWDTTAGTCNTKSHYTGTQDGAVNYANKQMGQTDSAGNTINGWQISCS